MVYLCILLYYTLVKGKVFSGGPIPETSVPGAQSGIKIYLDAYCLTIAIQVSNKCSGYLRKQATVVSITLPFVTMDLLSF